MKILKRALSIILALSLFIGGAPTLAVGVEHDLDLPITENGIVAGSAGYKGDVTVYSEAEADAAGVPLGYSGQVVKVAKSSETGTHTSYPTCDFDFSSQNISVDDIESITFRIYMYNGDKAIRLKTPYTNISWVMNVTPTQFGAWTEITLGSDGTNFNGVDMNALKNSEGNLGQLAVIGRLDSSGKDHFFIDSISIKYKSGATNDKTPPVISYDGPYSFEANEGEKFSLNNVTAFDEYDNTSATITYEWSSGAINGTGALQLGTHTCTVRATDRSGNSSTISITVNVKANKSVINLDSIPYTSYIEGVSIYDGTVQDMTADEAAENGVPAGYSGNVLKVSSKNPRFGMTFDPTGLNIPIGLIEYISFRVYMNVSTNALRISNCGATEWIVLANLTPGAWVDYTISADGSGFSNSHKMGSLADENGNLGIFGIGTKYESGDYAFYIDSISVKLKDDDGEGPVLNYSGKTDILTSCGKVFEPGIIAYDELEDREVALVYEWSEGALDGDGKMLEGEHTCRVSATDYYGNTSYLDLNVTVGPPDVEAPEILFFTDEIYVSVGTYYRMLPIAMDNYDDVKVVEEWSEGAIDFGGRLAEGVHTLTLTATDLSGNKTVKVVTVYVIDGDSTVGKLVQCGS